MKKTYDVIKIGEKFYVMRTCKIFGITISQEFLWEAMSASKVEWRSAIELADNFRTYRKAHETLTAALSIEKGLRNKNKAIVSACSNCRQVHYLDNLEQGLCENCLTV